MPAETVKQTRAARKPKRPSNVLQFPIIASEPLKTASLNGSQSEVVNSLTDLLTQAKNGEVKGFLYVADDGQGGGSWKASGTFNAGPPGVISLLGRAVESVATRVRNYWRD